MRERDGAEKWKEEEGHRVVYDKWIDEEEWSRKLVKRKKLRRERKKANHKVQLMRKRINSKSEI